MSFASPCVVPLVPGYLSYLAAVVGARGAGRERAPAPSGAARRALAGRRVGGLFVAGFTVVFVLGTVVVLGHDKTLNINMLLQRVGGVVTIVMGLVFLGMVPALQRDARSARGG